VNSVTANDVGPSDSVETSVECPKNSFLTGGGASIKGSDGETITSAVISGSEPFISDEASGWTARATVLNRGDKDFVLTAYAVCAIVV
jgi:hypothetical protein